MKLSEIAADLRAEQEALDVVVSGIPPASWKAPTPSPGWTVSDQIGHLTYFDCTAALAVVDPAGFHASMSELQANLTESEAAVLHRHLTPGDLLHAWRGGREQLNDAASSLQDSDRVPWYGPSMGAKSFLTARLMETWAHGQDVVDAIGAERSPTDRLRHIVQMGFITRGWTYINRGLTPPADDVRLELASSSGEVLRFGPDAASDVVSGQAVDFCLVVTQRRHLDDTGLEVVGHAARDWLEKAQTFAGPPTDGPHPGVA